jgi:hypothetical protein
MDFPASPFAILTAFSVGSVLWMPDISRHITTHFQVAIDGGFQ